MHEKLIGKLYTVYYVLQYIIAYYAVIVNIVLVHTVFCFHW